MLGGETFFCTPQSRKPQRRQTGERIKILLFNFYRQPVRLYNNQ